MTKNRRSWYCDKRIIWIVSAVVCFAIFSVLFQIHWLGLHAEQSASRTRTGLHGPATSYWERNIPLERVQDQNFPHQWARLRVDDSGSKDKLLQHTLHEQKLQSEAGQRRKEEFEDRFFERWYKLPEGRGFVAVYHSRLARSPPQKVGKAPRLVDVFMFSHEFLMLEVRLNTLASVVGAFVLVESTRDAWGNPKGLHFLRHRHRYARFLHKIVHVMLHEPVPPEQDDTLRCSLAWTRLRRGWETTWDVLTRFLPFKILPEDLVLKSASAEESPSERLMLTLLASKSLPTNPGRRKLAFPMQWFRFGFMQLQNDLWYESWVSTYEDVFAGGVSEWLAAPSPADRVSMTDYVQMVLHQDVTTNNEGPMIGGWNCEWCFASETQYLYALETALVCANGLPWSDFNWHLQHVKFLRQTGHWFSIFKWKLLNMLTEHPGGEDAYHGLQLLKQGGHPTAQLPWYVVRSQQLARFRLVVDSEAVMPAVLGRRLLVVRLLHDVVLPFCTQCVGAAFEQFHQILLARLRLSWCSRSQRQRLYGRLTNTTVVSGSTDTRACPVMPPPALGCFQAHVPKHGTCFGYARCGYLCVGEYCSAALHQQKCLGSRSCSTFFPDKVLDPRTGRCADPRTLEIYSVVADKFFPKKVEASNATPGGCYQAYVPRQDCSDYERCGFHCVGDFCSMDCDDCDAQGNGVSAEPGCSATSCATYFHGRKLDLETGRCVEPHFRKPRLEHHVVPSNTSILGCFDAHKPEFPHCQGYPECGFHCVGDWCGYSEVAASWEGLGAPIIGAPMKCKCNCRSCANFHHDKVFDHATARCVRPGWGHHVPGL